MTRHLLRACCWLALVAVLTPVAAMARWMPQRDPRDRVPV